MVDSQGALWGRALRGRSEDLLSRFGSPTGRGERVLALVVTMVNMMWVAWEVIIKAEFLVRAELMDLMKFAA